MSNNQLKYVILAGLFAIPFVPLIVSSSLFFPFITGKAFVFRLVVEIIFAAYLVLAIRDESYRPKFSWIGGAILMFLLAIGLADVFAVNPFKAFWSNFERMEGYITLLHLGAYFLVLGSVLKTQEIWNRLLATSLAASTIVGLYSIFQLFGKININQGGVRVDGTFGNASYLGIYMVFHIFFAALLFVRFRQNWQRVLLGLVALLDLTILYYTATRGAILGLLGGALITFLFLVFQSEKGDKIRKVAGLGLVAILAFVLLFAAVRNTSFVKENKVLTRFASLSFDEIKTQGRYFVWPMAVKGFIEKPILGWGQEGFNFVFNKYYDPRMYDQEAWFDRAHNTYLDWLIAGGLLGLLSYLSIIAAVVYYAVKAREDFLKKEDKAIILGVLSAYLFHNLFVFDQLTSYILFFTLLAYTHAHAPSTALSVWEKVSQKFRNIVEREKWHPVFESVTLVILALVLYFVIFVPWRQNKNLLFVLQLASQGKVGTIADYEKPLKSGSLGFSESLEHVSQTALGLASSEAAPTELKQALFETVDIAFKKHVSDVPDDTRYRVFYGLFLSRFGWYGRAIGELETAIKLSPRKQQLYFELANNYLLDGKTALALATAKTAYEILPSYSEARMVYGLTAAAAGDAALANQILADLDQSKLIFDDRYLNILFASKQYEKMFAVARQRVDLEPSNLDHRLTLAGAYLQAGRRAEAVSVLQQAIALDPSFKEQGEYFIAEINAGRNP